MCQGVTQGEVPTGMRLTCSKHYTALTGFVGVGPLTFTLGLATLVAR